VFVQTLGITDARGKPWLFTRKGREAADASQVQQSACSLRKPEGSGTLGWSLAAPTCFLTDEGEIAALPGRSLNVYEVVRQVS
jgi:hypothetical protein